MYIYRFLLYILSVPMFDSVYLFRIYLPMHRGLIEFTSRATAIFPLRRINWECVFVDVVVVQVARVLCCFVMSCCAVLLCGSPLLPLSFAYLPPLLPAGEADEIYL